MTEDRDGWVVTWPLAATSARPGVDFLPSLSDAVDDGLIGRVREVRGLT
jgi:hypothetical protein